MTIVLVQGVWTRKFKKYTAMMFIGTVMEVIGYVARIYAYSYPFSDVSFITQLCTLTLAPAFFAAAIYFSLSHIVTTFGAEASRISPKRIPRIFITCDIISLFLQAGGGGLAAYYAQQEKMPDNGNYTMIGGLSFQAVTLLVFLVLSADFAIRTIKRVKQHGDQAMNEDLLSRRMRRSKKFQAMLFSLAASAILIFMRSIYRVAELAEGWKGHLMTNERFVIWLEAIPVAIAGLFLCIFHPCNCMNDKHVPIERLEMPETPPDRRVMPIPAAYEEKNGQYGHVVVSYDQNYEPGAQHRRQANNYGGAYGRPYPDGFGSHDPKKWRQ